MGFVVAILITLAVMGSVMWVMPSPREKRTIAMRNKALSEGMRVRLLDQKTANKMFSWLDDYRGYVLYERYFQADKAKPSEKPTVVRLGSEHVPHELDDDVPLRDRLVAAGVLSKVPGSAEALVQFPGGVSLLWRESGGEEEVEMISAVLNQVAEIV